ncbi:hypothetical protein Xen7305DRAFT_00001970 [Xenococcus sp. PCC 7305]|uniref:transposase n=1 Tax=Xenococcus sp. PCC 7305 TaxID=102125 RepID=UPI0002AC98DC|nr:transposase [Xenococcus sp. PCC 7305]ELS00496.1 hypothetical protein Xen7305DRAFT_00001970 [Xenococcus sp. PCC 7305]
MTLYKNKYRIESTRLSNYDYSANGYYFVTICTHQKYCYFGNIINAQMQLSQLGKIAQKHWQDIPNHFNDVYIDEYVIMPNHVHGIVVINKPDKHRRDVACYVSTATNDDDINQTMSKLSPEPGSLGVIIRSYKSSVTRWCRQNDDDIFRWQPRFYENIIRDQKSLNNIRRYIINNPAKWLEDQNHVD